MSNKLTGALIFLIGTLLMSSGGYFIYLVSRSGGLELPAVVAGLLFISAGLMLTGFVTSERRNHTLSSVGDFMGKIGVFGFFLSTISLLAMSAGSR